MNRKEAGIGPYLKNLGLVRFLPESFLNDECWTEPSSPSLGSLDLYCGLFYGKFFSKNLVMRSPIKQFRLCLQMQIFFV